MALNNLLHAGAFHRHVLAGFHLVVANVGNVGHELAIPLAHKVDGPIAIAHQWIVDNAFVIPDSHILVERFAIFFAYGMSSHTPSAPQLHLWNGQITELPQTSPLPALDSDQKNIAGIAVAGWLTKPGGATGEFLLTIKSNTNILIMVFGR